MTRDLVYLDHIREAIERITAYSATGREEFFRNRMAQDAVIRNFEIIGEAVRHLSDGVKDRRPGIPWRRVAGFRNVLIHDYMNVDNKEVWNIIETHLPALRKAVEELLKS
jgi:uncharacterized protein with HEPN domain